MREFAIIDEGKNDFSDGILRFLPSDVKITVFQTKTRDFDSTNNVSSVQVPQEIGKSMSKTRNFITKHYFDRNFDGFLHVIEEGVEILKDPAEFLDGIEEMMTKLRLKSWFNTETDPCNYTFKRFNPRISVEIDEPEAKEVYDKTIYFTSHANTSWICYDFSKSTFEDFRLDDKFTIAMFYIIEFLARRRNTKARGELNYMNFYPTIPEERGVFRLRDSNPYDDSKRKSSSEIETEKRTMAEENAVFQSVHVNNSPSVDVEEVIQDLFNILART